MPGRPNRAEERKAILKVCGIDISGKDAVIVVLNSDDGTTTDETGDFKKLTLLDDENPENVQRFHDTFAAHIDTVNPDAIGLLKRNKGGTHASGSLSFKIEGILQMYKQKPVELVHPATVRAYKKRAKLNEESKHKYQQSAFDLAHYLLSR